MDLANWRCSLKNKFALRVFSDHNFTRLAAAASPIYFFIGFWTIWRYYCRRNLCLERTVGVNERPRLLNLDKAIAMVICLIIVDFIMRDVACEFSCAVRMHRNECNLKEILNITSSVQFLTDLLFD